MLRGIMRRLGPIVWCRVRVVTLTRRSSDPEGAEQLAAEAAALGATDGLLHLACAREDAGLWQAAERLYHQAAGAGDPDAPRYAARARDRGEGKPEDLRVGA